jgi:glycine betaine/proline transport system permease protein
VVRALNSVNIADGFEAGLAIVIVAIVLDRLCKQRVKTARRAPAKPGGQGDG